MLYWQVCVRVMFSIQTSQYNQTVVSIHTGKFESPLELLSIVRVVLVEKYFLIVTKIHCCLHLIVLLANEKDIGTTTKQKLLPLNFSL